MSTESTVIPSSALIEQELSSRKGLRRFWCAITGSNKRLQDIVNDYR